VALFGNTLVCVSVRKNPRLRTKIGIVILALATTDLIGALVVIPLTTAALAIGITNVNHTFRARWISYNKERPVCWMQGFLLYVLTGMSVTIMALAAIIRYFCVVKPNFYRRYITNKVILTIIGVMCLINMVIQASLVIPGHAKYAFIWRMATCMIIINDEYQAFKNVVNRLLITLLVGIPVVIIFVCHTLIYCTVRRHNRSIGVRMTDVQQPRTDKHRKQTPFTVGWTRRISNGKSGKENETPAPVDPSLASHQH